MEIPVQMNLHILNTILAMQIMALIYITLFILILILYYDIPLFK